MKKALHYFALTVGLLTMLATAVFLIVLIAKTLGAFAVLFVIAWAIVFACVVYAAVWIDENVTY